MSRSRVALLDVNVLVALFDPDHVHHELAHDWFSDNRSEGWATCPLTENGLVRVLTNPRYGSSVSTVAAVVARLRRFRGSGHHEFWPDGLSICTAWFRASSARGHRQLTDAYLLGLAQKNSGRLATFDRSIPLSAVAGATEEAIAILGPDDSERPT
jgi:toxin-antitoxin system PIN domain toxin